MDVQHRNRPGACTPLDIGERRACDGRDRAEARHRLARHPIRHESAFGEADQVDAVHLDVLPRLRDQAVEVSDIIDSASVQVAAVVGGVPEGLVVVVADAVGQDDGDPVRLDPLRDAEIGNYVQ